ncbi:unnamed protein product [Ixodes pacificus]
MRISRCPSRTLSKGQPRHFRENWRYIMFVFLSYNSIHRFATASCREKKRKEGSLVYSNMCRSDAIRMTCETTLHQVYDAVCRGVAKGGWGVRVCALNFKWITHLAHFVSTRGFPLKNKKRRKRHMVLTTFVKASATMSAVSQQPEKSTARP